MSIQEDRENGIITLLTAHTAYQMKTGPSGHLLHCYYGRRCGEDFSYLHRERDCGGCPNPYELQTGRGFSLDTMPQEYPGSNGGDYRVPALLLRTEGGICGADLRYVRHEIRAGKYSLTGLPNAFQGEDKVQTLSVILSDAATGAEIELLYGVFEKRDIITRAVRIRNAGGQNLWLEKASSACLELPFGSWDRISFHGRHAMERQTERVPVQNGIQTVSSERGISGHQHNPFVIFCDREANEEWGECYGLMLCYSGCHQTEAELDQTGSVRAMTGLGERYFSWRLEPGGYFETPEVFLCYSAEGLTGLSQRYHRFIRENVCRSAWTHRERPVLLNSWEAAYFDFDEERLLRLAEDAKELGVEMLVLDDGWFGERNSDNRALGDWFENRKKLPEGLGGLIRKVNGLGLKFGLWIEPEMISENSELFRTHPDWALTVPGRKPAVGREQLVLDLTRGEIVDWVYETFSSLLRENNIEYIKWDMNRPLSDLYSPGLPPDRQGEVAHRYMLGVYELAERLTEEFPDVLFEGCAGGGGRYDAGMLAYFSQIWCSDNTDPVARLRIQEGSSYGYPMSAMGAHVSASPNHQTGRSTPLGTRAVTAMAGTFGYELDPGRLSESEKEEIRAQIGRFHEYSGLIREGRFFRLRDDGRFTAWQTVSEDGARSLVSLVLTDPTANPLPLHLRLRGLLPEAGYTLVNCDFFGCVTDGELSKRRYSGGALLYGGLTLPRLYGDYPSVQLYFEAELNNTVDASFLVR